MAMDDDFAWPEGATVRIRRWPPDSAVARAMKEKLEMEAAAARARGGEEVAFALTFPDPPAPVIQ